MSTFISSHSGDGRRDSLSSQVARELAQRIDAGEIRPGDQLPTERELMETFGVSRTVIREAMSSLRSSGRIATQQGRGAFVLAPLNTPGPATGEAAKLSTIQDVLNLLDVRIGLESEAAAVAALNRRESDLRILRTALAAFDEENGHNPETDIAFHLAIARATNNPYFVEVFSSLAPKLVPYPRIDLFGDDQSARKRFQQRINVEHAQIVHAIERGDPEAARAAIRLHLANSRERLRQKLEGARAALAPE